MLERCGGGGGNGGNDAIFVIVVVDLHGLIRNYGWVMLDGDGFRLYIASYGTLSGVCCLDSVVRKLFSVLLFGMLNCI